MKIDYSNKVVLITGATRGIGKSIADLFYKSGATLILTGTNKKTVDQLNADLITNKCLNKRFIQVDFTDPVSTNLFLSELRKIEKIDVCINNAGDNRVDDFINTSEDDYDHLQNINVRAPYKIMKIVGPKMLSNNYGRIVNIASIWSVIARPGRSLYTTTKNALVGLTKAVSIEWASQNVLVNSISPGFTLTELTKSTNTKEQLSMMEKLIPAQRMANPIEIARVVAFLCSDLNTYLTGQNITVDGGFTNV
jgi:3-oxoacyl-[acyl-carrier protein] reductase